MQRWADIPNLSPLDPKSQLISSQFKQLVVTLFENTSGPQATQAIWWVACDLSDQNLELADLEPARANAVGGLWPFKVCSRTTICLTSSTWFLCECEELYRHKWWSVKSCKARDQGQEGNTECELMC
jgi:hypothetical protein